MNIIRVVLLVLSLQASAFALEIPEIQKKLYESSVSVTVGDLKDSATGFFATPPDFNQQIIVTCLHCIIDNIKLSQQQMGLDVDIGDIWVKPLQGGKTLATKVIAYHPKADVVYLQSPFSEKMPELEFAEEAPEPDQSVFALRHDWKKPEDQFSFVQSRVIAVRNDHGTGEPSHIYHWGEILLRGFSGSALVNESAEIVGINFMSANPYYNLSEHYRGFKFIHWLEKPMDATTFFLGPMNKDNIVLNDIFWSLSSMEDQQLGYDINLIFYAYKNLAERTFVNFFFSRLIYDFWLDPLLDGAAPESLDEKSKLTLAKTLDAAHEAKTNFLNRMRISSVRATLECSELRIQMKYKKLLQQEIDSEEKNSVIQACEHEIHLLESERKNFDRQYYGGDAQVDSTKYLNARWKEIDQIKKTF